MGRRTAVAAVLVVFGFGNGLAACSDDPAASDTTLADTTLAPGTALPETTTAVETTVEGPPTTRRDVPVLPTAGEWRVEDGLLVADVQAPDLTAAARMTLTVGTSSTFTEDSVRPSVVGVTTVRDQMVIVIYLRQSTGSTVDDEIAVPTDRLLRDERFEQGAVNGAVFQRDTMPDVVEGVAVSAGWTASAIVLLDEEALAAGTATLDQAVAAVREILITLTVEPL